MVDPYVQRVPNARPMNGVRKTPRVWSLSVDNEVMTSLSWAVGGP